MFRSDATRPILPLLTVVTVAAVLLSCADSGAPEGIAEISFSASTVQLEGVAPQSITIRNTGPIAVGPIAFVGDQFRDGAGTAAIGIDLAVTPFEIAMLHSGDSQVMEVRVPSIGGSVPDGTYLSTLRAIVSDSIETTLDVGLRIAGCLREPFDVVSLSGPSTLAQGTVHQYVVDVRDSVGAVAIGACVSWTVSPATVGYLTSDGRFVGYAPGLATIIAASGLGADTVVTMVAARGLTGSFATTGTGPISARYSSDLWVHGTVVYVGTWSSRGGIRGNTLYVWDVTNTSAPVLSDSVAIDAGTVNDVKVRADGTLAVVTHEWSNDGLNGITLLDLTDPLHPTVITRFFQSLEIGVHNVWIEGDYVYVAVNGASPTSGLRVLDISNPSNPTVAASFYAGSSILHDVHVRDGLAFLSHWNAGLVILDVGNGVAGGSPTAPVEVSRLAVPGGQTHNAWYWPQAGYVFVGEEDFSSPGIMHVIDVRDLSDPRQVATFAVPGTTPHNFWLDEASGVLYLAWYSNGLVALDVSGDLMGELDKQGRQITIGQYAGSGGCPASSGVATCTWAPQVHDGKIYLADMNTGLWVVEKVGF